MTEEKLQALLADMTLQEKIGQLMQLDASCFDDHGPVTGNAGELGVDAAVLPLAGSILGAVGAEQTAGLQALCMAAQPHHIPLLFMADIINGYKTAFPIPLALGCTFDPGAGETVGDVMAREAAAAGLHVTFAPMVDLVRDARWGRVMESTGEDPCLNSRMAAGMVRGIQGGGPGCTGHLGACTKHFAGYGAPDAGREYNNVELSERTLRQDYLPAYKAAIDAGSAMVMTSFNTLNRVPATANTWLMQDVLRGEMGFDGVLVSDWNAIGELIPHGVAGDKKQAARLAMAAGVDMDMMSGCYPAALGELVGEGSVSAQQIDTAVLRILTLKNKLGLFENPYRTVGAAAEKSDILTPENRAKARKIAAESMVLLENKNDFLPLTPGEDVAFIGPYVDEQRILGAWSFFANPADCVTLRQGVEEKTDAAAFAPGCGLLNPGQTVCGFRYNVSSTSTMAEEDALIAAAVKLAAGKSKVVLALGEANIQTGEGGSRGDITLPAIQQRLLDAVYAVNRNLAVVVFAGRPLDIRALQGKAKSILYAWMPGTEGGHALADVLYGDAAPQGRLSMSLPYCVGQVPVCYSELRTGRHSEDGENPQNRFFSKYSDIPNSPLYPFGYGLGYTCFGYSDVRLSADTLGTGGAETLTASVTVENTGDRPGVETVQLYLTDEVASAARPGRELKGFQRVGLQPGERKEISFAITGELLKFYDIHMNFTAEKGAFTVWIGPDSRTKNGARFTLA